MKGLDVQTLQKFLKIAGDRLHGNWVVMGGTVLPLLGNPIRSTVDIDLAGPSQASQKDTLILMEIAEELGLPVETINQAGAFFLFQIKGWENKVVELHKGKTAVFFRPNVDLFLELKIHRLNESDLSDCLAFLSFASKKGEKANRNHLMKLIKGEMKNLGKSEGSEPKKKRLDTLLSAVDSI